MTFQILLDVTIGLVLVYALFSLFATILVELINSILNRRGRMLELALYSALDDQRPNRSIWSYLFGTKASAIRDHKAETAFVTDRFFRLKTIRSLMDKGRLPTYITSDAFARGALKLIHEDFELSENPTDYASIAKTKSGPLANLVTELSPGGELDEEKLLGLLAVYYEDLVDRVGGWFRRETNIWLLIVGFFIAIVFNVNSIDLSQRLASDSSLRESLVAAAQAENEFTALSLEAKKAALQAASLNQPGHGNIDTTRFDIIAVEKSKQLQDLSLRINNLKLPIGRCRVPDLINEEKSSKGAGSEDVIKASGDVEIPTLFEIHSATRASSSETAQTLMGDCDDPSFDRFFIGLFGWLITALALSLGAPFWFDLLSKLVAVRKAGKFRTGVGTGQSKPSESVEVVVTTQEEKGLSDIPKKDALAIGDVTESLNTDLNIWEQNNLSKDDIKDIQHKLEVPPPFNTGTMNEATRKAIHEYRRNVMKILVGDAYIDADFMLKIFDVS